MDQVIPKQSSWVKTSHSKSKKLAKTIFRVHLMNSSIAPGKKKLKKLSNKKKYTINKKRGWGGRARQRALCLSYVLPDQISCLSVEELIAGKLAHQQKNADRLPGCFQPQFLRHAYIALFPSIYAKISKHACGRQKGGSQRWPHPDPGSQEQM